jgi:hypothetical protein
LIYAGIDDTDIIGTPGTNQLARLILKRIGSAARDAVICRHQLFFDPRVPYTSKNGSASIQLPHATAADLDSLGAIIREVMREWFVAGSDPGLCLAMGASEEMHAFSLRCKCEVITREEARAVAARAGCYLEGLGGTEQGIIGALAAIGLIVSGNDGRVVHLNDWPYPEDNFSGVQTIDAIYAKGVHAIRELDSNKPVMSGFIDAGKHLRPNWRGGRIVLYVNPETDSSVVADWRAVKVL